MREEPPQTMRVVAIPGSLRDGSHSRMAARIALDGAETVGAETELIDLRAYELTFCCGKLSDEDAPPDVLKLRKKLRAAHGIILVTPEYHGSLSGVLKNALDLMGWHEFEGKMLGLVGVSGGMLGGVNALTELRTIGRVLHAWVVPEQAVVAHAKDQFDADGTLKDERLAERLLEVGRQVGRFARLHNAQIGRAHV